ncbi:MAG: hypothetical protein KGH67_04520 [Candidatus Micrarchaeota archaeon]|nr:hypothetical protein [Candidatus Micrarchaeota archaeon]
MDTGPKSSKLVTPKQDFGSLLRGELGSIDPKRLFFISDTHFDDDRKMQSRNRPFDDVESMNRAIVKNWNEAVGEGDIVIFVGDMTYKGADRDAAYWTERLHGNILFIKGNNDIGVENAQPHFTLTFKGKKFYIVHDPDGAPQRLGNDTWLIHGHMHDKDLDDFPFVHVTKKRINVSVEVLGYVPVSLDTLLSVELQKLKHVKRLADLSVPIANAA